MLRCRKTGLLISVVLARCCHTEIGVSWLIESPKCERQHTTVLALLNKRNNAIESLRVLPSLIHSAQHIRVRPESDWLKSGVLLEKTTDLLEAVTAHGSI
jgi:hypothetical protein